MPTPEQSGLGVLPDGGGKDDVRLKKKMGKWKERRNEWPTGHGRQIMHA